MDGKFVPNNSIDFDFNLPNSNIGLEAHLMINNPAEWIKKNWQEVNTILVHFESCQNLTKIMKFVKNRNKKIGLALNPKTPINDVKQYLKLIDQLLIMTVRPGFYGAQFLPETIKKISQAKKINPNLNIEVDGGITPDTIKLANNAGANMFVSGSFLIKSDNIKETINTLKNQLI
jgi:ribulose-phosphate 3-epimerase